MPCISCKNKWYICRFCKTNTEFIRELVGYEKENYCCNDIFYCKLCNSWLKTWYQIYPDKKPESKIILE
jgi:hypothetical protein